LYNRETTIIPSWCLGNNINVQQNIYSFLDILNLSIRLLYSLGISDTFLDFHYIIEDIRLVGESEWTVNATESKNSGSNNN
jgi:hypothetical protein